MEIKNIKLSRKNIDANNRAKIMGIKSVLQSFNQFAESENVNFASSTGASGITSRKEGFSNALIGKLAETRNDAIRMSKSGSLENRLFAESKALTIGGDIADIKEKFTNITDMFAESMLAGTYKPFQLAMIPYIYLETISANFRFIMPSKNYTSEQIPPKKLKTKILIIDGVKYMFPNCLKDAAVMNSLVNSGSTTKEITVTAEEMKSINVFSKIDGMTADGNRLLPQLDIVGVSYNTTDDVPVVIEKAIAKSALLPDANNYSSGKISKIIAIKDKNADTTEDADLFVAGEVNFTTGDVKLLGGAQLVSVTLKVYIAGDAFRRTATVDVETKEIIQLIKKRVNYSFSYDPGALAQYMQLEKIDGVLEGQSIMFDSVIAAKDAFAFGELKSTKATLKTLKAKLEPSIFEALNDYIIEKDHYTLPSVESGIRPISEEQWETDSLGKRMKEIHTGVYHKFNSKNGVTLNWYASPANVARFVKGTPIISKGEDYGGYCTDFAVFSVSVAQSTAKVVESERVDDADGINCLPYSNSESQPTFEFQQGSHMLYTDGTIRDAAHPHLPNVAYYDYFDCQAIFNIMGCINVTEGQAPGK